MPISSLIASSSAFVLVPARTDHFLHAGQIAGRHEPSPRMRSSPGKRPSGRPRLSTSHTTAPTATNTTPKIRIHLPVMFESPPASRKRPNVVLYEPSKITMQGPCQ